MPDKKVWAATRVTQPLAAFTTHWYTYTDLWFTRRLTMFLLKGILRAESQEKILVYLLAREAGYGKAIAEFFDLSPNATQKQLARLEEDGVVVSHLVGKLREYRFNPRYAFLPQLQELLKAALISYPAATQKSLTLVRNRPRQPGKPMNPVR